mgnify:CR=1 FL=1
MAEIFEICDRVTVFKMVLCHYMDTGDICADDIIRAMVGRELGNLYPTKSSCIAADDPVLEVNGLTGSIFREVSFALRRGEILVLPGWWARDGARLCAVCAPLIPSVPAR